jgi:hypothetical protein
MQFSIGERESGDQMWNTGISRSALQTNALEVTHTGILSMRKSREKSQRFRNYRHFISPGRIHSRSVPDSVQKANHIQVTHSLSFLIDEQIIPCHKCDDVLALLAGHAMIHRSVVFSMRVARVGPFAFDTEVQRNPDWLSRDGQEDANDFHPFNGREGCPTIHFNTHRYSV